MKAVRLFIILSLMTFHTPSFGGGGDTGGGNLWMGKFNKEDVEAALKRSKELMPYTLYRFELFSTLKPNPNEEVSEEDKEYRRVINRNNRLARLIDLISLVILVTRYRALVPTRLMVY